MDVPNLVLEIGQIRRAALNGLLSVQQLSDIAFKTAKEGAVLLGQHLAHLQQPRVAPRPAPVGVVAATPNSEGEFVLPFLKALRLGFCTYCVFVVTISALLTLGMWLFGWRGMTVVRVLFPVFVLFTFASWGLATWAGCIENGGDFLAGLVTLASGQ